MPSKKDDKKQKHSFSPGAHGTVYLLGAMYLVYLLVTFLQEAYKGGEDAPSLPLLIVGILVLGGGVIFLALMAWRMSRVQPKATEDEEAESPEQEADSEAPDGEESENDEPDGEEEEADEEE
ncbi:MAG: hypothetical protein LUE89_10600 [Clostridiales bacterium]|nr:hypothetical protein [Clostridiales bacterium]